MDYTGKILKGLYDAITLLKDIKNQNKAILKELKEFPHLEELDSGDCGVYGIDGGDSDDNNS